MNSEKENKIIPFAVPNEPSIDFGMEDPENWDIMEEIKSDQLDDKKNSLVTKIKKLIPSKD